MRLGIPLESKTVDPEEIAREYARRGYGAAVCPAVTLSQPERIKAIREAFARHDVVIAEVGVWNNMLDVDPFQRAANIQANMDKLALADEVGALCCVNTAGSFSPDHWDGPHPRNLTEEAFEMIVQTVRYIIDAVNPKRAYYTLETMPWVYPDSPESNLELIKVIDRPMFGVHLDPVNMINCPSRYYQNASFLRECFQSLSPWIIACHGKDILMRNQLTLHLDEVRPGLGVLDYGVYLWELSRLPGDVPLIIEHLPQEEYLPATDYVRMVAHENGLAFNGPSGGT